jgi:hypothetical protein
LKGEEKEEDEEKEEELEELGEVLPVGSRPRCAMVVVSGHIQRIFMNKGMFWQGTPSACSR